MKIIVTTLLIFFSIIFLISPNFLLIVPKYALFIFSFVTLAVLSTLILKIKSIKGKSNLSIKTLGKKSEELNDEKRRLKLTIENIKEGIIITDRDGNIIDVNKMTLKTLNTTGSKISNTKIQELIHLKDDRNNLDFNNIFNIAIEDKKSFSLSGLKLQIPNSSDLKDIDDSFSPILNDEGEVIGTVLIFRDVTKSLELQEERMVLEQKIDQLERIGILGDFISGIAHNFGNIIGNINGQIEMIKTEMQNKDKFEKRFNKIDAKIEESKQLIKKLTVFNTSIEFEKTPVNINKLIENNKASLLKIIPSDTNIEVHLESNKMVKIDLVDFDRLFLTILSYLKKNLDSNSYIHLYTYDTDEGTILEFNSPLTQKEMNYYMFNINEILKRNNAELIIVNEKETNIKILFKI